VKLPRRPTPSPAIREAVGLMRKAIVLLTGAVSETEGPTRRAPDRLNRLTRQQSRLAPLLVGGLADKEIAERLALALPTVRGHLAALGRKFDCRGRVALACALAEHIRNDQSLLTGSRTRKNRRSSEPR
jgi:DNA-binding NarL/FixJ family response regulator